MQTFLPSSPPNPHLFPETSHVFKENDLGDVYGFHVTTPLCPREEINFLKILSCYEEITDSSMKDI